MSSHGDSPSAIAIVPAAGMGRRMGTAKQTLPFAGSTMTGTVVRTLLGAGVDRAIVVTRTAIVGALDLPDDPRVVVAVNEDADSEMIDSVRIGLASLAHRSDSRDGVMVVPGDMPAITVETCRRCVRAFVIDPARVVIAAYGSRRGHPIVFPLALRGDVEKLTDGLRELARAYVERVHIVETDDPGVVRDVDTREDYVDSTEGRP